jgi:hypothetical protein
VTTYTYDTLPAPERQLLPAEDEVIEAVEGAVTYHGQQLTLDEYFGRLHQRSVPEVDDHEDVQPG